MSNLSTTKLSSKGQVVIPESIRDKMGLKIGDQFVVIAQGDALILKTLTPPSMKEFDSLIVAARHQAKKAKLTKKSLAKTIKESRKK